jgi:hypothetical protein
MSRDGDGHAEIGSTQELDILSGFVAVDRGRWK